MGEWKGRFNRQGIEGLKLAYKGAKSYLTPQERDEVLRWLHEQEYWDLSELECYLIDKFDVVFKSPTSYYTLFKEAKISGHLAQPKNPRQEPEIVKKKSEEIQTIVLDNLEDIKSFQTVLYAIDEVHLLEFSFN